jgi:DNA-directed RNA polymerase subunit beta
MLTVTFINPTVSSRVEGEFEMVAPEEVKFMDVSPNQLVSVSASLIPFLENDDANRALMGSNMQRQAVPLIRSEAPLVGTGMEPVVARDSGVTIVAECDGVVVDVDSKRIVVKNDENEDGTFDKAVSIYSCTKFVRSNQNTCFNHRPIVEKGERLRKARSLPMDPPLKWGSWPWAKTSPWPSCPGTATTMRTPSSSVSAW